MQVGESLCNTNTDLAFLHLAIGAACKHNREEFNGVMGGLTGLSGKESSVMDADRSVGNAREPVLNAQCLSN